MMSVRSPGSFRSSLSTTATPESSRTRRVQINVETSIFLSTALWATHEAPGTDPAPCKAKQKVLCQQRQQRDGPAVLVAKSSGGLRAQPCANIQERRSCSHQLQKYPCTARGDLIEVSALVGPSGGKHTPPSFQKIREPFQRPFGRSTETRACLCTG